MPVNHDLANDNYKRYSYARDNGHIDYLERDRSCNEYFEAIQWEEKVRRALTRAGRPALTINQVFVTMVNLMGEQLKNRVDATLRPGKDGSAETAEALAKVVLQILNDTSYDRLESQMFDDGLIGSRGYIDLRLSFDDNFQGEASLGLLNPRNVVVDPDAEQYDPDTWKEVFLTKWMLPEEVSRTYGKKEGKLLERRTRSAFDIAYDSIDEYSGTFGGRNPNDRYGDKPDDRRRVRVIERQFREYETAPHFVNPETGDTRLVPANWDEYRVNFVMQQYGWEMIEREAEIIKARVTADDVLLMDSYLPLRHFTPVPFFPIFRRGRTISWVENMRDPQNTLNKTVSQELHVINSSANGGWKIKHNSLKNMDIDEMEERGSKTGLILELEDVNDAEKIQPNQIPTGLDRKSYQMGEFLKQLSGVSDSDQGFDREDVAAKAIREKRAAGSTTNAKLFENLAMSREILVRNLVDLVQEYYTEERVFQIEGRLPGQEPEELVVNQVTPEGDVVNDLTIGEYGVVISQVPSRNTFYESQLQEAISMTEVGVQLPPSVFIENSNLAKKAEILEAMANSEEQQRADRMADLELQEKELGLAEKQSDTQRKRAETLLAGARARKTNVEAGVSLADQGRGDEGQQGQQSIEAAKLALEREIAMEKLALEREIAEAEFRLKQEELRQTMLIKRAEASMRAKQQQKQLPKQGAAS